jgi:hypothetical protein
MRWVGCFGHTLSTWVLNRASVVLYIHLLYLFLEDPVSDFIIKRREIGVELPATRKYFCPKMREPNLILDRSKMSIGLRP